MRQYYNMYCPIRSKRGAYYHVHYSTCPYYFDITLSYFIFISGSDSHFFARVFDTSIIKKVLQSLAIGLFLCQLFCFAIYQFIPKRKMKGIQKESKGR